MDKYASETLVQQEEEAKALLGFTWPLPLTRHINVTVPIITKASCYAHT